MTGNKDDGPADAVASGGAKFVLEPKEVDVLCGRGGMSNHHPGNEWYRRLIRSNRPLYRACPKHTKLLVSKAIVQAVEQQGGRFLEKSRATGYWCAVAYKRSVDKTSQGLRERDKEEEEALNNMHNNGNSKGNSNNAQQNGGGGPGTEGHVPASWTAAVTGGVNGGPNLNDLAVVAVAQANLSNKGIGAGIPPNRPAPKRPAGSATLIGSTNTEGPLKKRARATDTGTGTAGPNNNHNPNNNHIHTHNNNNNTNRAFLPQLPQQLQQQIQAQYHQQQQMQHAAHPPTAGRHQSSMFGLFPQAGLMQRNDTSGWSDRALAAPPPPPASQLGNRATSRGNPVVLPTQLNNLQLDKSKAPLKVPPRKKGYMANTPSGVLGQANTQAQVHTQTKPQAQAPPPRPGQQQQPPFAAAGSQQQPPFAATGSQQQPPFAAVGAMSAFRGGPPGMYPQRPPYGPGPSTSFGRGLPVPPPGFGIGGPGRLSGYTGPPYPGMPTGTMNPTGGGTSGAAPAAAAVPPGANPPPALSRLTSQVSDWLCNSFWPVPRQQHQLQQQQQQLTMNNHQTQQQQQQQQQLAMNNHQTQQQQQLGMNNHQTQQQQLGMNNHQTQTTTASSSSSSPFATPNSTPPPPPSRRAAVEQAVAAAARIPRPPSKKVAKKAAKKSTPLPAPPIVTLTPPDPNPTIEITKVPEPTVQHYQHQPAKPAQPRQRKTKQRKQQQQPQQQQQQQLQPQPPKPVRNSPGKRKSRSILPQLPHETAIHPSPVPNAAEVGYPPGSSVEDEYYDADTGDMEGSPYTQDATAVSYPTREESMGNGETYEERGKAEQNDMPTELEQSVSATLLKLAGAPSKLFSGISSLFDRSETIGENESECTDATLKDIHANTSTNPSVQSPPEGRPKPSLLDDFEESPMEARLRTVRWS